MSSDLWVAVDVSPVRPGTGGVGRYVADLIAHLPDHAGDRRLTIVPLTNRPQAWHAGFDASSRPAGAAPVHAPPPSTLRRPTLAWLQWEVPRRTRRPEIGLFHATTGRAPLGFRAPFVVTVHDTAVLDVPALFPYRERWLAGRWLRAAVPRAAAVICVSGATRDAVLRRWPRTAGRLVVIRPGVHPRWSMPVRAMPTAPSAALGSRYWLHVGACTTVKNVVRLVEAFARVHSRVGTPPPALMLVGPPGDADARVRAAAADLGVAARVRLLGPVDDATLRALYAGAELSACVGLHEGFGLTALESLAAGCPVVSSGRGGLREAAPYGALVADPTDGSALEEGLIRLATDTGLRASLAAAGRAHAASATWPRAAGATATVYAAAAAHGGCARRPLRNAGFVRTMDGDR